MTQLPMATSARTRITTAIGVIMIGLGAFVALRPLWSSNGPLTDSWWLDGGFAFFFLVRGVFGVRTAGRRWTGTAPTE